MRLRASAPVLGIDPDNDVLNWVWFCAPDLLPDHYRPPATERPPGNDSVEAPWRAWRKITWQYWQESRQISRQHPLWGVEPPGMDEPDFPSMQAWPELQHHCQRAWAPFRRWFTLARAEMLPLAQSPHVRKASDQALRAMSRRQEAHVCVVALADPDVLIEQSDRAVVTAGLLASPDEFSAWLVPWVRRWAC